MADGKARKARRAALGIALAFVVWLLGVWPPPVWWRDHWPRQTAMMRWAVGRYGGPTGSATTTALPSYRPTVLRDISDNLERMVILAEDWRFRSHHGIDFAEVRDALGIRGGTGAGGTLAALWRRRDRLRGASTITQQLAKNLYLSPSRNPLRKLKEAAIAVRLELALSKDRILELYLSVAEWGPGLWGVHAASRAYFGESPARLDARQAAALAATLPHPRSSNPVFRPARMLARRDLILARYHGADVRIPQLEDLDLDSLELIPILPPVVVPPVLESLIVDSIVVRDTGKSR